MADYLPHRRDETAVQQLARYKRQVRRMGLDDINGIVAVLAACQRALGPRRSGAITRRVLRPVAPLEGRDG